MIGIPKDFWEDVDPNRERLVVRITIFEEVVPYRNICKCFYLRKTCIYRFNYILYFYITFVTVLKLCLGYFYKHMSKCFEYALSCILWSRAALVKKFCESLHKEAMIDRLQLGYKLWIYFELPTLKIFPSTYQSWYELIKRLCAEEVFEEMSWRRPMPGYH